MKIKKRAFDEIHNKCNECNEYCIRGSNKSLVPISNGVWSQRKSTTMESDARPSFAARRSSGARNATRGHPPREAGSAPALAYATSTNSVSTSTVLAIDSEYATGAESEPTNTIWFRRLCTNESRGGCTGIVSYCKLCNLLIRVITEEMSIKQVEERTASETSQWVQSTSASSE